MTPWKRFMAVGCSHGSLANPKAIEAVLEFKRRYRPQVVVHLGDAIDVAAFRSGAKGSNDEAIRHEPDLEAGLDFLTKLRPDVYLLGNHEARLWSLRNHYNAIVSGLAQSIVNDIEKTCKKLKCKVLPWEYNQSYKLGDYSLMHGWFFNEMAARDHAETFGNVIFAHTHRASVAKGRRTDSPTGINAGCLIDIPKADYAKARRATQAWANGFVWGEFCDDRTVAWLHEQPQHLTTWRLPV